MNRREAVVSIAAGLAASALPGPALARGPMGQAIIAMFGERRIRDGRVKVDLPGMAEDGSFVALTVTVDSTMSGRDRVVSVGIFAPANPNPLVASIGLGPNAPKAEFRTMIRLAQSQNVYVIAQMADGSLWRGRTAVTVTPGSCESLPVQ